MTRHGVIWILVFLISQAVGCSEDDFDPRDFRIVGLGQPNTRRQVQRLGRAFKNVEIDFMLNHQGNLIGAHDPEKLALIESGQVADSITLADLLEFEFDGFFLDMKNTLPARIDKEAEASAATQFKRDAERAVEEAARVTAQKNRSDRVYIMAYTVTEQMVRIAEKYGVNLMIQGYPRNEEQAMELVRQAARHGLSRACIPLAVTTRSVVEKSRALGISHIPYSFLHEGLTEAEYYSRLTCGLEGIIVPLGQPLARLRRVLRIDTSDGLALPFSLRLTLVGVLIVLAYHLVLLRRGQRKGHPGNLKTLIGLMTNSILRLKPLIPFFIFLLFNFILKVWFSVSLDLETENIHTAGAVLIGTLKDQGLFAGLYSILLCARQRRARIASIGLLSFFLVVVAADAAYFSYTLNHLEIILFENLNLHAAVGVANAWFIIVFIIFALAIAVWSWLALYCSRNLENKETGKSPQLYFLLGLLLVALSLIFLDVHCEQKPESEEVEMSYVDKCKNNTRKIVSASSFKTALVEYLAFLSKAQSTHFNKYIKYSEEDKRVLRDLRIEYESGWKKPLRVRGQRQYRRIVVVIIESLPADYLHFYNGDIPKEAAPFIHGLIERYPHFDNYFTANMPTGYGLNSMFMSRLDFLPEFSQTHFPHSLFSLARDAGYKTHFVRGVSLHYKNENRSYRNVFRIDNFVGLEDLRKRYPFAKADGWGYHDDLIYREGSRILENYSRDEKILLVLKTIDLHQPGVYVGTPSQEIPDAVKALESAVLSGLYWTDACLAGFFGRLEKSGLFDGETLVIVTSDHNPHPGGEFKRLVPAERYDRLVRIPLILVAKDMESLSQIQSERYGSQIDFAPTLIPFVRHETLLPPYFLGRNLLDSLTEGAAVGYYNQELFYWSEKQRFAFETTDASADHQREKRALAKWHNNTYVVPRNVGSQ